MISYAQNGEDVVLARAFAGRRDGFYIDVGAEDPVAFSVTKHFYDMGWRGINIEPTPSAFAALERERPDDVNLRVGLADYIGTATLFEGPPDNHGSSTFDAHMAEDLMARGGVVTEVTDVPMTTLASICQEWVGDREIDFLKIDVEGMEHAVISGADWRLWRPRVVVVEAVVPNSTTPSHHDWEPVLLDAGYVLTLFDGLNRFYVRSQDQQLVAAMSIPANVTDHAICFRHADEARTLRGEIAALRSELDTCRSVVRESRAELDERGTTIERIEAARRTAQRELHLALDRLAHADDEIAVQEVEAVALRGRAADNEARCIAAELACAALARELAALEATRTFRWTRTARAAYAQVLRRW